MWADDPQVKLGFCSPYRGGVAQLIIVNQNNTDCELMSWGLYWAGLSSTTPSSQPVLRAVAGWTETQLAGAGNWRAELRRYRYWDTQTLRCGYWDTDTGIHWGYWTFETDTGEIQAQNCPSPDIHLVNDEKLEVGLKRTCELKSNEEQ